MGYMTYISCMITEDGFLRVSITPDMIVRAQAKSDEMGVLKNSIRKGTGNLCGFLGEEAVLEAWPGAVSSNTYQHDLVLDGHTFEVKSKDRTVPPRLSYEASIARYNPNQRADFYVFVSLFRQDGSLIYEDAYICGIISKHEYFKQAKKWYVGDIDYENDWTVKADCFNLKYAKLTRFGEP